MKKHITQTILLFSSIELIIMITYSLMRETILKDIGYLGTRGAITLFLIILILVLSLITLNWVYVDLGG